MRTNDPNYPQLLGIAAALGSLVHEVVFVGGSTAGLLHATGTLPAALPAWLIAAGKLLFAA